MIRKGTENFMEDLLQVGVLSSTHGVRGEMKIFPTTDDVKRFKKNKEYILETPIVSGEHTSSIHVSYKSVEK